MDHSASVASLDKTASRFLHLYLLVRPLVLALFLGGSIVNQLRSADANSPILGWFYLLAALCLVQSLTFLRYLVAVSTKKCGCVGKSAGICCLPLL